MSGESQRSLLRDFKRSLNRDRVSVGGSNLVDGFHRLLTPQLFAAFPERYAGDPATPTPPSGGSFFDYDNRNGNTFFLRFPEDYHQILMNQATASGGFNNIGTVVSWTDIKPETILSGGQPAWFKISYRVWGLCPLFCPQASHERRMVYLGNSGDQQYPPVQAPNAELVDTNARFYLVSIRHLSFFTDPITGASIQGFPLNFTLNQERDPTGLWEIDRVVTAFAKYDGRSGGGFQFFYQPDLNGWRQETSENSPGSIFRGVVWHEPNGTLFNPVSPYVVRPGPGVDPNDNGATLFGTRDDYYRYRGFTLAAKFIGVQMVSGTPTDFSPTWISTKERQVSSYRG